MNFLRYLSYEKAYIVLYLISFLISAAIFLLISMAPGVGDIPLCLYLIFDCLNRVFIIPVSAKSACDPANRKIGL